MTAPIYPIGLHRRKRQQCAWCGGRLPTGQARWTKCIVLFETKNGRQVTVCEKTCLKQFLLANEKKRNG